MTQSWKHLLQYHALLYSKDAGAQIETSVLVGCGDLCRQYGADYVPLEEQAKAAHVGVWEGPFTPPNEWRKQQKAGGAATANQTVASLTSAIPTATNLVNASAPSCPGGAPPIKGNIGKSGDKIYHKPGGALYDRVRAA